MIPPTMRGKLVVPSLARACYEYLAGEFGARLAFGYCNAGLVRHYRKLGFRPYAAPLIRTPDCMGVAWWRCSPMPRSTARWARPWVLREMMESDPRAAAQILFNMGRVLSERLATIGQEQRLAAASGVFAWDDDEPPVGS